MCGICGIWNYATNEPVERQLLQQMNDSMGHRGPDDYGLYFDDSHGVGIGFRRLAIIDLSLAGHQPMKNEDGSIWLAFNGEIYNFQDLRPALEANGHVFRSRSDTEVIIHQYEEKGPQSIADLWGMFGLAIWDSRKQSLLLARDRVGKKPLYYYDDGRRIVFASELKAIVRDRTIPRQLDPAAIAEYLSLGYIGSPRTIFTGIHKLLPGHYLIRNIRQKQIQRYWDWLPAFQADTNMSEEEWIEQIRTTLREVVRVRMTSDVPIGAFLSGGVDSSAVAATMATLSEQPIKTFSIGFTEQSFNELPYARQVAQRFATDHHEYIVQPETISDLLPRLAYQFDEPFGDPSALPTYYVSKIARQEVTVCLSGDGGDEAMAGYLRYAQALNDRRFDRIPHRLRRTLLSIPATIIPPHIKGNRMANRLMGTPSERYLFGMQTFYAAQAEAVLSADIADQVQKLPHFLEAYQRRAEHLDFVSQMQYVDGMTYLPEDILVKVDRTSMLNSLETRCPLLDHRFLELAARIPHSLRLNNGDGKYIFKKALRGLVPDAVMDRSKMGFVIPGRQWIVGDASAFVQEVLCSSRTRQRGIFRHDVVQSLIANNRSLGSNVWSQIWSLLIFELWCRAYLDNLV